MIITISGITGSGKTTIGRMLAKKLGYKFYSMGDMRGEMALELGITIDDLNEIGKKEFWTDKKVDDYTKRLGEEEDNFVIDGWVAFHFIPNSFKIFLDVDIRRGAERVFKNQRKDERKAGSVEDVLKMVRKRIAETDKRYKKYYDLDFRNEENYDVVIDTTDLKPGEVVDRLLNGIKRWGNKGC